MNGDLLSRNLNLKKGHSVSILNAIEIKESKMFEAEEFKNRLEQRLFRPYGNGSYLVRPYGQFFPFVYQIDTAIRDRFLQFWQWIRYAGFGWLILAIALQKSHPILVWPLFGMFALITFTGPVYLILRYGARVPADQWPTKTKSEHFAGFSREYYGRNIVFSIVGVVFFGMLSYFGTKAEGHFTWFSLFTLLPLAMGIYSFIGYRQTSKRSATLIPKNNPIVGKKTSKTLRGFVIAPLPMQLIVLFQLAIQNTLSLDGIKFAIITIIASYAGMLFLGVPVYFFLKRHRLNALGYYIAASFIPASLSIICMLTLRPITMGQALFANVFITIIEVIPTVVIFWFIARPDKT